MILKGLHDLKGLFSVCDSVTARCRAGGAVADGRAGGGSAPARAGERRFLRGARAAQRRHGGSVPDGDQAGDAERAAGYPVVRGRCRPPPLGPCGAAGGRGGSGFRRPLPSAGGPGCVRVSTPACSARHSPGYRANKFFLRTVDCFSRLLLVHRVDPWAPLGLRGSWGPACIKQQRAPTAPSRGILVAFPPQRGGGAPQRAGGGFGVRGFAGSEERRELRCGGAAGRGQAGAVLVPRAPAPARGRAAPARAPARRAARRR